MTRTDVFRLLHALPPSVMDASRPPREDEPTPAACPTCRLQGGFEAPAALSHESVCAGCGGRFLTHEAARELLADELGLSPEALALRAREPSGPSPHCPGCGDPLSTLDLDPAPGASLCTGCGGLWFEPLDGGEDVAGRDRLRALGSALTSGHDARARMDLVRAALGAALVATAIGIGLALL